MYMNAYLDIMTYMNIMAQGNHRQFCTVLPPCYVGWHILEELVLSLLAHGRPTDP